MKEKVALTRRTWLRKIRDFARRLLWIQDSPQKIALGLAIGVFWGIMPTFGFAILFSLPTALLFKGNRLAAILGTFVNNPLTFPFVYALGIRIGQLVLGSAPVPFSLAFFRVESLLSVGKSLLVGSIFLAAGLALLTYFVVLQIIIRHRAHHPTK